MSVLTPVSVLITVSYLVSVLITVSYLISVLITVSYLCLSDLSASEYSMIYHVTLGIALLGNDIFLAMLAPL